MFFFYVSDYNFLPACILSKCIVLYLSEKFNSMLLQLLHAVSRKIIPPSDSAKLR